ncbi:MAG: D-glucuronyl C5-epimerase family protein [Candidatus Cloacimonadaceae bacterium]|nr:D-glucuronyl C5-epimerase family protein [Candidatus Cloacimonadaceae bacterium]
MLKLTIALMIVVSMMLVACNRNTAPTIESTIIDHNYSLVRMEYRQLYQNRTALYNNMHWAPVDENGVSLFAFQGQDYYHPVMIGQRCQQALSDFNNTNDQRYLNYVRASIEALSQRATRLEDKILFPYEFDYPAGMTNITYIAPWYSGMAQGILLSLFSRMYYLTGETRYRELADSTFATLRDLDSPIPCVYISKGDTLGVADGYYWVDEYPHPTQRFVLNGSIIGSFGLYDYWWVFGNKKAARFFSKQMTTVRDNILLYRNPAGKSYYCLKFRFPDPLYHALHQILLNQCFIYTGDLYFQAVSQLLYTDFH